MRCFGLKKLSDHGRLIDTLEYSPDINDALKKVEDLLGQQSQNSGGDVAQTFKNLYETSGDNLDDASETLRRLHEASSGDLETVQKTASEELNKLLTSFNVTDISGKAIDTTNEKIDDFNIWLEEK